MNDICKIKDRETMININRIQAQLAYWHMRNIVKKRPLDINIETTTICPMRCRFCCNRLYQREQQVMGVELFEKIVMQFFEWGGTWHRFNAVGLSVRSFVAGTNRNY